MYLVFKRDNFYKYLTFLFLIFFFILCMSSKVFASETYELTSNVSLTVDNGEYTLTQGDNTYTLPSNVSSKRSLLFLFTNSTGVRLFVSDGVFSRVPTDTSDPSSTYPRL